MFHCLLFEPVHPKTAIEGRMFPQSTFALPVGRKKPSMTDPELANQPKKGEEIPKSQKYVLLMSFFLK